MDVAFKPMDEQAEASYVQDDGTISYKIVEGDTFLNGVRQPKFGDVIYVQDKDDDSTTH
jgi:hypothetical protein